MKTKRSGTQQAGNFFIGALIYGEKGHQALEQALPLSALVPIFLSSCPLQIGSYRLYRVYFARSSASGYTNKQVTSGNITTSLLRAIGGWIVGMNGVAIPCYGTADARFRVLTNQGE